MTHPVIIEACQKHGVSLDDFFGTGRKRPVVACRTEAARILRERGNSWVVTARIIKRSRDTARYWLDDNVRKCRKNYMLKRWHDVYKHEHRPTKAELYYASRQP